MIIIGLKKYRRFWKKYMRNISRMSLEWSGGIVSEFFFGFFNIFCNVFILFL